MRKHHPKNERIKRRYLAYLEEAKRMSAKSTDQVAAALAAFEESTRYKDFAAFHIEQARKFKRQLSEQINPKTGKPLAKATIRSRLMHAKAFFHWLAGQPGYRSKLSYSDSEYFNPSANDTRIATAQRDKIVPSEAQIKHVLNCMPSDTGIERRDRALIAFTFLTGLRDDAIASLSIRHVDLAARTVFQDARTVRTKNRKTLTTSFFPVGDNVEDIVRDWISVQTTERLYGPDDPLFPSTKIIRGPDGLFAVAGLTWKHWSNANTIRKIFRMAFEAAGLPYFNPHVFRDTLEHMGQRLCQTPEEFKAWSQNLGHERVLTSLTSYGSVSGHRQAEIMGDFRRDTTEDVSGAPDRETIRRVIAHLNQQAEMA